LIPATVPISIRPPFGSFHAGQHRDHQPLDWRGGCDAGEERADDETDAANAAAAS